LNADALLLLIPSMNTPAFLTLANEMLGYSPSRAADAAGLKNQQHLIACLAGFRDKKAVVNVKSNREVYCLLHYGCLFASEDIDMPVLLEVLGGMPFALTTTKLRGIQSVIATGSLLAWRIAVIRGCRPEQPKFVRRVYGKIYTQFCNLGLAEAFFIKHKKLLSDDTFTLED